MTQVLPFDVDVAPTNRIERSLGVWFGIVVGVGGMIGRMCALLDANA